MTARKSSLPLKALAIPAALGVAALALIAPRPAAAADPQGIVDALKTVAGNPPNMRATFARGQCVRGTYTPSADIAQVTNSVTLSQPRLIVARFSVGGGNPNVPDTTKTVLRGFAVKFFSDGRTADMLFENAPVHFAKTLDQMLGFLQARAPGSDGKPNAERIAAFAKDNPETTRQGAFIAAKPLPGSFAGIVYWGVHTFTATNAAGKVTPIKFKVVPEAGEIFVSDEEAKSKPARFLVADLTDRIAKEPVKFDIVALLGEPTDQTMDITQRWADEDNRKGVKLGTVAITALEPNDGCDAAIFDPANLPDGIGAPKDELFAARHQAYTISKRYRTGVTD